VSPAGADNRFRFVQLDVPGQLGLDDGRYLLRGGQDQQAETVVVVQTLGGAAPSRRSRRRRPRRIEPGGDPPEVPYPERRRRRAGALRPQERLAAVLAGREPINVCETLLLRARADLEQEHPREAALQLRAGLEALLAELPAGGDEGDQAQDLAALGERRESTGQAAQEALAGELSTQRAGEVAETLGICERVLRRRQILAE